MKKLDVDELEIVEAFESGKLKRVAHVKDEIKRHAAYAAATSRKTDASISVSRRRICAPFRSALREGLPYQTLIASVLHKFAEGQLAEQG